MGKVVTNNKNEKVALAFKTIEKGILEVVNSDKWKEYLKVQAKFHHYSFNNVMLILSQMPEATMVAGFRTWNEMGRKVKKGSKAIKILAPRFINKEMIEKDTDTDEEIKVTKPVLAGFLVVNVFDISQTEGKPIPLICEELKEGKEQALLILNAMKKVITIPVKGGNTGTAKGYYDPVNNEIVLSEKATESQKAKTIIHEYIHSINEAIDSEVRHTRQEAELVAESVAFIVCDYFGFDTSDYSFAYLASWSNGGKDIEKIRKLGERIQKQAAELIDKIEKIVKMGG